MLFTLVNYSQLFFFFCKISHEKKNILLISSINNERYTIPIIIYITQKMNLNRNKNKI